MTRSNRRRFLRRSAAALVAAGCPAAASRARAADEKRLPIVDTHQHLWDLVHLRPAWIRRSPFLRGRHGSAEYREATEGLNVTRAIYMEIALPPTDHRKEVEYVTTLCRSTTEPTCALVAGGHPADSGFDLYADWLAENPYVKGVRQILHGGDTPRGYCLQTAFVRSIKRLGRRNLSFDLCLRATEWSDAVRLVDQCPDTRFVVDHCGNADPKAFLPPEHPERRRAAHDAAQWRRDMAALAQRSNVTCKISGIVARVPHHWNAAMLAPIVDYCLEQFGPERVVFGSDWPVCNTGGATLAQWVAVLGEIIGSRPLDERKRLLSENAAAVYRL